MIAQKRVLFFKEFLRSKYFIDTNVKNREELIRTIHNKTGVETEIIERLLKTMNSSEAASDLTGDELVALSKQLDDFFLAIIGYGWST